MATTGQKYPTASSDNAESPWSDNTWGATAANIYSDDGNTANITSPTFDTGDQSNVLKGYSFNFSEDIPDGSTIEGVICRVNAWYRSGTGSASLDLMMLLDTGSNKGGTNQCSTPAALTTDDTTVITRGSSTDLWGNLLTSSWVRSNNFGIALGVIATDDNADVDIDYVSLEIYYTAPSGTNVTPAGAGCISSTGVPTAVMCSIAVAAGTADSVSSASNPTAILGSVSSLPLAAISITATSSPDVNISSMAVYVTPGAAVSICQTVNPYPVLGGITCYPACASVISGSTPPYVLYQSYSCLPSIATLILSTTQPNVLMGYDEWITFTFEVNITRDALYDAHITRKAAFDVHITRKVFHDVHI